MLSVTTASQRYAPSRSARILLASQKKRTVHLQHGLHTRGSDEQPTDRAAPAGMTKVVPSTTNGAETTVPKTLDPATVKWSDRPVPEDGGVTHVSVELIVEEGFKVDTHNGEFFQATFAIVLEWTDPRILAAGIDTSDQSAVPKDIWRPAACFPANYEWADPQRPVTFISLAPGRLLWWRLTKPTRVDISSAGGGEERFRSFPFDSARIDFLFCMSDEIKLETDVDIELGAAPCLMPSSWRRIGGVSHRWRGA